MGRYHVRAALHGGPLALLALLGFPSVALAQRGTPPLFGPPAEAHLPSRRASPPRTPDAEEVVDLIDNLKTAWEIGSNLGSCIEEGGTLQDCLARVALCDILPMGASAYYGHIGGSFTTTLIEELHIFDAFRTTACGNDCFWCCLTPTGCHSSFGPSPVINCNARYGLGSRTIGYTLITSIPMGTEACLAIPQTCDLYSQCAIAGSRGYPGGLTPPPASAAAPSQAYGGFYTPEPSPTFTFTDAGDVPDADASDADAAGALDARSDVADADVAPMDAGEAGLDPRWTPPRGVSELRPRPDTPAAVLDAIASRKVRMFAESVARLTAEVLDAIPPEHALDELSDMLSMRGCLGHRTLITFGEPFDGTHGTFGATLTNPRVQARVSTRRALHFLATLRVLSSVPNLRNRFVFVESRTWTVAERAAYLRGAGIVDADRTLRESMSALALRVLQRADGLQDYRLLAVPLAGEVRDVRRYNGCRLGVAPRVTVTARSEGNDAILDVTATETDPADPRIRELPVAIEWGDDTTARGSIPVATPRGSFRHTFRRAGRYAAVVSVAGQSGLHGLAGLVFDASGGDPSAPRAIGFERVIFPDLRVFTGATGNRAPGSVSASLALVEGARSRRIGRAPTRALEVRETMTTGGMDVVVRPGLTSLGDLVGYNTGRLPAHHLDLRVGLRDATTWDGRNIELRLRDVRFSLFSAGRGVGVEHSVRLTPTMLRAYYGSPPTVALMTLPTDPDGTVRVPLVRAGSTTSRTPILDHIEVDLDPLLSSVDLGTSPLTDTPAGVRRRWSEIRPGVLEAGPVEGLPPEVDAGVGVDSGREDSGEGDSSASVDGASADADAIRDAGATIEASIGSDARADGGSHGGGSEGCACGTSSRRTGGTRALLLALCALALRRRRTRAMRVPG